MTNNICKRCLLSEASEGDIYKNIKELISAMPEEQRASTELYEKRLSQCKVCDNLLSGMCRICGCYVELRAAKVIQKCPAVKPLW